MRTHCITAMAIAAVSMTASATAQQPPYSPYGRQGYSPYSRPTLSPYLNLLRGGNPAANYYMGVVPEVERRANQYQNSMELQDLQKRLQTPAAGSEAEEILPTLPGTGHPTGFMTLTPYFTSYPVPGVMPAATTSVRRGR